MTDVGSRWPSRRGRRAVAVLLAGLVLLAIVPSIALAHQLPFGPRVGHARPATSETVVLNITDSAFEPATVAVPSNTTVELHLYNVGKYNHTFTLVAANQTNKVLASNLTVTQLDAYFAAYPPQQNVSLAPGKNAWANFSTPSLGSYEFVSVVPYQFQAGLSGTLKVELIGPAQSLVDNTTNSFAFDPSLLAVTPPGHGAPTTINLKITNQGDFPHTFTLAAQSNASISTVGYFATNAPLVNVTVPSSANAFVWANFTVTAPGIYEFVCTVPGHFQAGMFGFLYVGVPVPVPPPPPSTAIVEIGVLIGAFVLLGIGVVLVVVAGFVGRFERPPGAEGGHGGH